LRPSDKPVKRALLNPLFIYSVTAINHVIKIVARSALPEGRLWNPSPSGQ
jgi:hypothetical protein